jgi:hypothetical protein
MCDNGRWKISSICHKLEEAASAVAAKAALMFSLVVDAGADSEIDFAFARRHPDVLVAALSEALDQDASQILLEIEPVEVNSAATTTPTWKPQRDEGAATTQTWKPQPDQGATTTPTWGPQADQGTTTTPSWKPQPDQGVTTTLTWKPQPEQGDTTTPTWKPQPEQGITTTSARKPQPGSRRLRASATAFSRNAFLLKTMVVVRDIEFGTLSLANSLHILNQKDFSVVLRKQLRERNLPGASGGSPMVVVPVGQPEFAQDVLVPAASWLVGDWSSCSSTCGDSSMTRATHCFAGVSGSCEQQGGPQPRTQRECQDYSTCPFEVMCPLGQGNSFSCPAQAASMFAMVALPFMLAFFCGVQRFRRMLRPVDNGASFIKPLEASVSFNVIRPGNQPENGDLEAQPSPSLLLTPKGSTSFLPLTEDKTDGRTRVVWNIDVAKVQHWFEGQITDGVPVARAVSGSPVARDMSWRLPTFRECTAEHTTIDEASPLPAYMDSELVEYFSATNQQWVAGSMSLQPSSCGGSVESSILLNVQISRAQLRIDVPLHCLRSRLLPGDLVEVLTDPKAGAAGKTSAAVVTPEQPRAATLVGYQVRLLSTGELLSNVGALRLRRRFPAASLVQVYRGLALGWCEARVHDEAASVDGCGAEVLPMPGKDSDACLQESGARTSQELIVMRGSDSQLPFGRHCTAADTGIWTRIALCSLDGSPEWVPSYLLRTSTQGETSLVEGSV